MKKYVLVLAVMCFGLASTTYAAESADGVLELETGYEIALSPKVSAYYMDGVNTAGVAQQWYVAATTHTGGTYTYATAADITKIYKLDNDDGGDRFDDAPQVAASEEEWSTAGWEL